MPDLLGFKACVTGRGTLQRGSSSGTTAATAKARVDSTLMTSGRLPAFDFTKGSLILVMVLYHWLNYFLGPQGSMYKYLRFLTPSFIFLTGFTISHIYLAKYDITAWRLPIRLLYRGFRLLITLVVLNVVVIYLAGRANMSGNTLSVESIIAAYIAGNATGTKVIVFAVLAPISYLLMVSAALVAALRHCKYLFHITCGLALAGILVLNMNGVKLPNLELLAIGLIGVSVGFIPTAKLNSLLKHPHGLILGNLGYAFAISIWNEVFVLQIVGVCVTLALWFWLGFSHSQPGPARRLIMLLGKYSLFGYIAQIAILQLLRRGVASAGGGAGVLGVSFVAAFVLTTLSVVAVDRARGRASFVNKAYVAVFA
jgi:hypothetical protein